jgi:hypothetical protein
MKKIVSLSVAIATLVFAAAPASAEMGVEEARTTLVPFYKALNAEFAKDAPELIRQSTPQRIGRPAAATRTATRATR